MNPSAMKEEINKQAQGLLEQPTFCVLRMQR